MGHVKSKQKRIEIRSSNDIFVISAKRGELAYSKNLDQDSDCLYIDSCVKSPRSDISQQAKNIIPKLNPPKIIVQRGQLSIPIPSKVARIDVSHHPSYWRVPKSNMSSISLSPIPNNCLPLPDNFFLSPQENLEISQDESDTQFSIPSFDSGNDLFDSDHKRNALIKPIVKYSKYKLIKASHEPLPSSRYSSQNLIKDLFNLRRSNDILRLKPISFNISDLVKRPKVNRNISWCNMKEMFLLKGQSSKPCLISQSAAVSPKSPLRSRCDMISNSAFKLSSYGQYNNGEESKFSTPSLLSKKSRAERAWKWKGAHGEIKPITSSSYFRS